ncbi:uncharacterized protein LOC126900369 isoform X2 [Daktulosphaira vitifoliae]|nr:uncharacterized protein LOC126900369 isoform X2 [Daktulosphaira vitifoliae]
MLKHQAVGIISELLTSDNNDLVLAVLRAHISFLSNAGNFKHQSNNLSVVSQILGKSNVDTMNTLMNLLPNNPLVSKIIYLMSKVPQTRAQLAQSGVMEHIVTFLKNENNHYLTVSLCLLCECPLNRGRLVHTSHGLTILMDLISSSNPVQKELAMSALVNFQFDSRSLEEMVKKGLISLLIKNLSSYIQANKMPNLCPPESKIKPQTSTSFVSCASPAGSSGMSPSSPPTRSWTPPISENATNSYSPCYSPVCESFDGESNNADESNSSISDYEIEEDKEIDTPDKLTGENVIIYLLTNLSYLKNAVKMMATKDVWETILDYIRFIQDSFNHQKPLKILQMIVQEILNFKSLLKEGFILSTHQRLCQPEHNLESCKNCENRHRMGITIITNATNSFESKFAEDAMISIMNEADTLGSNNKLKSLISVTIPLVIQSQRRQLISMLFRYKTFDNLCNLLKNDDSILFDHSVGALVALFKTSNILYVKPTISQCENHNCSKQIIKKETTVTLALDDGTQVNANKSFLALKSPMFEAMFRCGGFKEAYQKTIRLNDVSSECFKSLIDLLEVCCECVLPKDIAVLLELITVTDRYMLNELTEQINMMMMSVIMTLDNCSEIYKWSKETGYQLKFGSTVSSDIIKYLFSSNSKFSQRVKAVRKLSQSQHGQLFIDDLSDILKFGMVDLCDDKISEFYLSRFANDCSY